MINKLAKCYEEDKSYKIAWKQIKINNSIILYN